ncbi:YdcH family protein [Paracoccus sp. (in: a-proteobacteria)]|uniref:YdcH family protein n=1 Tax=Paracoccus sp. TaxID=267 RepID=UPI0034CDB34F
MLDLIHRTTAKEDGMSVASHVEELRKKHQTLSEAVEKEQKRPGSDDIAIAQMKREKLRIKEEISRLTL